jgi:spore maturation protein CgeB
LNKTLPYYLNNESERLRISENGFNKVKKEHTYFKRTEQLIEIIKENL